jgi:hypothetical protein
MRMKCFLAEMAALLMAIAVTQTSEARVVKFVVQGRGSFAGGASWGKAGPYEWLRGVAYMEVDPRNAQDEPILDLDHAPRNARGTVEFSTPFVILKPVDMSRGNRKIYYNLNNRGNGLGRLLGATTAADVGTGDLEIALSLGYAVVDSGWEGDIVPTEPKLVATLPIAEQAAGQPIVGSMRYEYSDRPAGSFTTNLEGNEAFRSYPAADTDPAHATFTVRASVDGPKTAIPPDHWAFGKCPTGRGSLEASDTDLCYFDGFVNNKIYELIYRAKNPIVMGLGFAATRDVGSFLRYEANDGAGNPNPLGAGTTRSYASGVSQTAAYLRDYIYLGFNEDESHRKVFDGILPRNVGTDRVFINVRFADPNTYSAEDNHHDFLQNSYPPFTYAVVTDPISGIHDGIMKRPKTDPVLIQIDSDSEFWELRGSLNVVDGIGKPVKLPGNVRLYFVGNTAHGFVTGGLLLPPPGANSQCTNPVPAVGQTNLQSVRASLVNLDMWADKGIDPPESNYPSIETGTLVSLKEIITAFPKIPAAQFPTVVNEYKLIEFGEQFSSQRAVFTLQPPRQGRSYVVLVPKIDGDGIENGGVQPMQARVPLGTGTGWNIRKADHRGPDLCGLTGSYFPLPKTKAERQTSGDSRPSLEERYGDHNGFVKAVEKAAGELVNERFLLKADADAFISVAKASDILK